MPPGARQGRRVAIGIALIAALLAVAVVILLLGRIVSAARGTYTIVGVLYEAPRLHVGSPVRLAGYRVGEVTRVELLPPGADSALPFAATLQIPIRIRAKVRRDSRIRLVRKHLLGEPVVELHPGTPESPVLQPGDTLRGEPPLRATTLIAAASAVRESFDRLLAEGAALGTLSQPLEEFRALIIDELEATRAELVELEEELGEGPLPAFLSDTGWQRSLERIRQEVDEIARATRSRAEFIREAAYAEALSELGRRARGVSAEFASLLALLDSAEGFPARWQADPALRNAIERTRVHLDSLIEITRRKPWRYFF